MKHILSLFQECRLRTGFPARSRMGCGLRWSRVGSTTVSTNFRKVLCCPLFATPIIPSLYPWLSHYALLPQVHFGCKTCHVFVHPYRSWAPPLLWFKVCIVCSSAVEALPDHLWSSCIVSLTDLPVVWWTGGECLQGQGELSNAAGCMVSEWWSLRASADSFNHRLLIFCPDGWGVLCAPLTVHLNV